MDYGIASWTKKALLYRCPNGTYLGIREGRTTTLSNTRGANG